MAHNTQADPVKNIAAIVGKLTYYSRVEAEILGAANAFNALGEDMLSRAIAETPGQSIILSSYSAAAALAIIAEGAGGSTRASVLRALGLDADMPQGLLADLHGKISKSFGDTGSGVETAVANALWACSDAGVHPAFSDLMKRTMDATVETVDFGSPATLALINDWCSASTKGMIPKLLDQISPGTPLMLANATYFKGEWQKKFEKVQTRPVTFRDGFGHSFDVPMMHRSGSMKYGEVGATQAVALPYGKNGEFEAMIVLPEQGALLPEHIPMSFRTGQLGLPQMDLAWKSPLDQTLVARGMGPAYASGADYSAMAKGGMTLGTVFQSARMKVDEEGTVAAAVTGGMMRATCIRIPEPPFQMICNRPFIFMVRHIETNILLFQAYVVNPGIYA